MADFKCKYCGNVLHPAEGQTMITCGRCDETTRIITADNVKKQRLMDEAAELRYSCLFDRAMQRYESIIQEFPKEADAYWGYVLCLYGVEFQDDARTGKRLPTLHRISKRSILQDPYFQKAVEYANPVDASDYKRITAELEHIRLRFLELSQKEENKYDIFISFKQTDDRLHRETIDCSKAENLYYKLKQIGYQVFFSKITLANRGGDDYEPIIYTALDAAKIMLVIGSSKENFEAPWVRNEWNRFLDMMQTNRNKKILPIYFGDMTPEELPSALCGIQGFDIDTQRGVDRVLSRVEQLLPRKKISQPNTLPKAFVASEESLLKRAKMEAETKNWSKASEQYNKILDANPDCSRAWVGLMLSEAQYSDLDDYKEHLIYKWLTSEIESKSISFNEDTAEEFVDSSVVPNYLSEKEIVSMLPEHLVYNSRYKSMCENQKEAEKYFESNQNYLHAVKCADGSDKQILADFKNGILQEIEEGIASAKNQDAEISDQLKKQYGNELHLAKEKIMKMHQEALEQRENDYQTGMEVNSGKEVPNAIERLAKVGDYKEAPQKLEKLVLLQQTSDQIGDGSTYLAQRIIDENPQEVMNLQDALAKLNIGFHFGIRKLAVLALYAITFLQCLLSGEPGAVLLTGLGIGLAVVFWKKNNPLLAYAALAVCHCLAIALTDHLLFIVLAVAYFVSFVSDKGIARGIISAKLGKIAVDDAKKIINTYEQSIRVAIDQIWNNAIGINYDGVQMQGVLETFAKTNYLNQIS